MERLRGSIDHSPLLILLPAFKCACVSSSLLVTSFLKESTGDGLSSKCVEPGAATAQLKMSCGSLSSHQTPVLRLLQGAMQAGEEMEEEEVQLLLQQYQHRSFFTSYPQETNFQLLRRMQSQCHLRQLRMADMDRSCAVEQLESCVTHVSESETTGVVHHEDPATAAATGPMRPPAAAGANERKKKKRQRPASTSKSAEEAESQRMTHIAVERNRRHLMNVHLATLRSLMPPSFVQRGDQASIIGGAIEFVKELEQHLLSLRAQKQFRESAFARSSSDDDDPCRAPQPLLHDDFLVSPQYTGYSQSQRRRRDGNGEEAHREDWTGVDVEATLVQGHVNLKVAGRRQRGS
ncbi:Helix-loop-helix DNA-binding domain [Musa troglodytarum]|uniref:Helix-loop-helix DNA-binding domain n=2 Tax=Musa troglodytarum TaxID=320322 RepID=A0A9E7ERF7_9LILI|nr:Helix-loop-helix DNA-binding domain [Musa troglodytarum]